MQYLARKIGRRGAEIWTPTNYTGDSGVRADALYKEFRTKNDTLSLWQCDNTPQDLEEIALAFATSMEELEKFWIVLIEKDFLEQKGYKLQQTPGNTPIKELVERHFDLIELDAINLALLAGEIARKVRNNIDCYCFTKEQIRKLIETAISQKRITCEQLKEKVAKYFIRP